MFNKLRIDFDSKENELVSEAAKESDSIVASIKNMRDENIGANDILNALDSYTQARIRSAANVARIDIEKFIDVICISPVEIVRPILAKNASKTVFQEKLQFDSISKQSEVVSNLIDLPNGGKNALYVGARKSVDFLGYSKCSSKRRHRILIAAKYTKHDGGAQDNQRNDLIDFAEHAPRKNSDTNSDVIVLLADGPYYAKKRSSLGNKDFFAYVDEKYSDRSVIATTTEDFDLRVGPFIDSLS